MYVNGNITLVEGGKVLNLTLPHGTAFPENGNLGEKFFLSTGMDADTPKGEYKHNGTTWEHKPTLAEVKQMISELTTPVKTSKTIGMVNVQHNVVPIGMSIFTNHAVARLPNGLPTSQPFPGIWIDPADCPAGTKLRIHLHVTLNATGSTNPWQFGMRKFLRPASGGGNGIVIYSVDTPILGAITVAAPQVALSERDFESAEFDMPATAGLYGFLYTQSGPNASNSVTQFTAVLKATY